MERKMFYSPGDVARMFEDDNFDEIFLTSIAERISDVDFQVDETNAALPLMNKQLELLIEEDIGYGNSSGENGEDAKAKMEMKTNYLLEKEKGNVMKMNGKVLWRKKGERLCWNTSVNGIIRKG